MNNKIINPSSISCMSVDRPRKSSKTGDESYIGGAIAALSCSECPIHAPGPVCPPVNSDTRSVVNRLLIDELTIVFERMDLGVNFDDRYLSLGMVVEPDIPNSLRTFIMKDNGWRTRLISVNERRILRGKNPYSCQSLQARPFTEYELRKLRQRQHLDDWSMADPSQVEGIKEARRQKTRDLKRALYLQRVASKKKRDLERKVPLPFITQELTPIVEPVVEKFKIDISKMRERRRAQRRLDVEQRARKKAAKHARRVVTEGLVSFDYPDICKGGERCQEYLDKFNPSYGTFGCSGLTPAVVQELLDAVGLTSVWNILSIKGYGEVDVAQLLMAIVSFGVQMTHATTQLDIGIAISQLQIGLGAPVSGCQNLLASALLSFPAKAFLLNKVEQHIVTESLMELKEMKASDMLSAVANNLGLLLTSDLVVQLKRVVLAAISFKLFDKDFSATLVKVLGPSEKMSMIDFVGVSLEALVSILRVYESIRFDGVPIHAALFSGDPIMMLHNEVVELLDYKDRLYIGLPVPGKMCQKEYLTRVRQHKSFADKLKGQYPPSTKKYTLMNKLCLMLTIAERDVLVMISGRRRHAPFGICLHGLPGIGKSKILTYLAFIWSEVKGRKFDDGQIYNRMLNSDYWDGHDPPSQPFIHYSEVGRQAYNIIKTNGDPVIDELTSLMDSLPMMLNVAFEGKGKVPACPELVLIDTNNPDMNVPIVVNNRAAVERRLTYLEPRVKRQFLKDDGCGIDYAKSMAAGGDPMDRWTFRLVLKVPVNSRTTRDIVLMDHAEDDDVFKLTIVLIDLYTKHIESEMRLHDLFTNEETYGATFETAHCGTSVLARTESRVLDKYFVRFTEWSSDLYVSMFYDSFAYFAKVCNTFVLAFTFLLLTALFYGCCLGVENVGVRVAQSTRTFLGPMSLLWVLLICLCHTWVLEHYIYATLLTAVYCIVDIPVLLTSFVVVEMRVRRVILWDHAKTYMCRLLRELGIFDMPNVFWNSSLLFGASKFALIIGAVLTVMVTLKAFVKQNVTQSEGHTVMRSEAPSNERLNDLEESYHCGNSYKRLKLKEHKLWNVITPIANNVFTGTPRQLQHSIGSSVRRCKVMSHVSIETYIFGVTADYALINVHSFAGQVDGSTVCISTTGSLSSDETTWIRTVIQERMCVRIGEDILLFRADGMRFKDRTKFFANRGEYLEAAAACVGGDVTRAYRGEDPLVMEDVNIGNITLSDYWRYEWKSHHSGACGIPVTMELGNGAVVCGLHTAGGLGTTLGFCEAVYKSDLLSALKRASELRVVLPIMSEGKILHLVEDPLPKSPFQYEHLPGLTYYGKLPGNVMLNNKSRLRKTPFAAKVEEALFEHFGFISEENYGPPLMRPTVKDGEYISPYNVALRAMIRDTPALDQNVLDNIIGLLTSRFVTGLEDLGLTHLKPLTVEAAINGVIQDPFLRRINCSTSSGFGWDGCKAKYLPIVEDDDNLIVREPVETLKERIIEILDAYGRGETANFVYAAQLKDEPRARRKVREGKTRVFYMTPLEALILNRMFLYPFYSLMVQYSHLFCTAVGINTHSEADKFVRRIIEFSEKLVELDVKNFDLKVPYSIHLAFRTVVYNVLKRFGYTKSALRIVSGLLTDNLFIFIAMNKDLFMMPGMQPSGKYATAEDNSGVLLVLLMYIWYTMPILKDHDFFENVLPNTYGDDLLAAVKAAFAELFNNVTIARHSREKLGVEMTTSSKGAVDVPIISIREASFLKRSFVLRDEKWIMPLDLESFTKMMMWYIPSRSVTKEKQLFDSSCSFLWELFFHVKSEEHMVWRLTVADWLFEYLGVPREESHRTLPTWEYIASVV